MLASIADELRPVSPAIGPANQTNASQTKSSVALPLSFLALATNGVFFVHSISGIHDRKWFAKVC